VQVERFVSLPAVLARASLVVCHGGAGTTLAALAHGVPLVIAPRGSPSQSRTASACERAGVARAVAGGAGAEEIRRAVRGAAAPGVRRAAAGVAAEIAGMPPAASLVPRLESLAAAYDVDVSGSVVAPSAPRGRRNRK
jgi:UDP:flavonoid glycosyltransferase YjiC (YdhE family)